MNTLFMTTANPKAILVIRAGRKLRKRTMSFKNEHAALDWCLCHRAGFVLTPKTGPTLAHN
jgi:hypothetical protein